MIRPASVEQSYATELIRKGIHLCSLAIPVIYYFVPRSVALAVLVPVTLAFFLADAARLLHRPTGKLYERYLGFLLRRHELGGHGRRLNGATYVLLSATLCILIFPKLIVVTAFSILIISDTSAALIGRRFGRHRFLGKSLEGSTAFLVSALLVVLVAPKSSYLPLEFLIGFIGALVGTVVEALPIPVDDNLSIPLSIGTTMWLLYDTLLPSISVFVNTRPF